MKIIDLTHPFTDSMPTYPGDSMPSLKKIASIDKEEYTDYKLETTMHVGTHIDAPAHMIESGKRIDELSLELFHGRGVVVDARGKREIDAEIVGHRNIKKDDIVFFCTGFSEKYHTPRYFVEHPVVTKALAKELVKRKIKMVGFDLPSPDRPPFAIHKVLFRAGILIAENITNLETLLKVRTFDVAAIPLRIGADAAFARIMAIIK